MLQWPFQPRRIWQESNSVPTRASSAHPAVSPAGKSLREIWQIMNYDNMCPDRTNTQQYDSKISAHLHTISFIWKSLSPRREQRRTHLTFGPFRLWSIVNALWGKMQFVGMSIIFWILVCLRFRYGRRPNAYIDMEFSIEKPNPCSNELLKCGCLSEVINGGWEPKKSGALLFIQFVMCLCC